MVNPKLRTRNSKGYTGISHCNTTSLIKLITTLNNQENLSITNLKDESGGTSLKAGISFLIGIRAVERVRERNNNRHRIVYRLSEDFKNLYNNLPKQTEVEKEIETKYNETLKINDLIKARISKIGNRKYPTFSISIPITLIRKYKLQRGDIIKLKPLEILRMTKIKEF